MKLKLTPQLAYFVGLWKSKRVPEGIGIRGTLEHLEVFAKKAIELKLTTSEKILVDGNKMYFYNAKLRKFLQDIEDNRLFRFKHFNEYSASYLAGYFDGCGELSPNGQVYLNRGNRKDLDLLYRLGFNPKKQEDKILIKNPKLFLYFIKNYVVIKKDSILSTLKGVANENT